MTNLEIYLICFTIAVIIIQILGFFTDKFGEAMKELKETLKLESLEGEKDE